MQEKIVLIYLIVINIVGFSLMGADKKISKLNAAESINRNNCKHTKYARIPEKTLIAVALALGGAGCFVGMRVFRHKTQKLKFRIGIPCIVAVNAFLIYVLYNLKFG